MKRVSILFFATIFFSSCEKETYLDYYFDNQSSSVTTVNGSDIIHSSDIDQTINPNEKKDVATWSSDVDVQRTSASHEYILVITDADF